MTTDDRSSRSGAPMVVQVDSQRFELVGESPHTRPDGSQTVLRTWRADCASCGSPFHLVTGIVFRTPPDRRRCDVCKAPGHRVRA